MDKQFRLEFTAVDTRWNKWIRKPTGRSRGKDYGAPWIYQGKPLTELWQTDIGDIIGFLYLIIVPTASGDMYYVGQTTQQYFHTYWGSSGEVKQHIKEHGYDGMRRYALMLFFDEADLDYAEYHLIKMTGAKQSDRFYNKKEGKKPRPEWMTCWT